MKTITLIKPEKKIKITKAKYIELRDKTIDNIMLNAKNVYEDDEEMVSGIAFLCEHLTYAEFNETSVKLVRGLAGFIHWSVMNFTKITGSACLTNLIHDLGEFRRNKDEDWFSPRTDSYDKYLN